MPAVADGADADQHPPAAAGPQDSDQLFRRVRQEALREADGALADLRGRFPRGDRRDPPAVAQTRQPLRRGRYGHHALHHSGFPPRLSGRAFHPVAELLQRSRGARQPPLYGDDPRNGGFGRTGQGEGQGGHSVREEQDRLGEVVHLGHQAAARHADAHDADHPGLPAGVFQGRRQVETPADDPQGHRRPHGAGRIDHLARGEQQVRADAVRDHPPQIALLGGHADRFGRGGVELRDQEHLAAVHRRGGQAASADRRDADGHPQFEGLPHRPAHRGQIP